MAKDGDQVDPQSIRRELLELAERIRALNEASKLLESAPELIRRMGNLRSKLFEWEVRCTERLLPAAEEPPEVLEAQRIIEEAARQLDEAQERWGEGWSPDREEEES